MLGLEVYCSWHRSGVTLILSPNVLISAWQSEQAQATGELCQRKLSCNSHNTWRKVGFTFVCHPSAVKLLWDYKIHICQSCYHKGGLTGWSIVTLPLFPVVSFSHTAFNIVFYVIKSLDKLTKIHMLPSKQICTFLLQFSCCWKLLICFLLDTMKMQRF